MIDFANKNIGGGVQQEDVHKKRQFFVYCGVIDYNVCQMNYKEATAIYGAERLSDQTG